METMSPTKTQGHAITPAVFEGHSDRPWYRVGGDGGPGGQQGKRTREQERLEAIPEALLSHYIIFKKEYRKDGERKTQI